MQQSGEILFKKLYPSLSEFEYNFAPESLCYRGNLAFMTQGVRVSVVGSRKASDDGLRRAALITNKLVERNIVVVSGLAEGIDTMAHSRAIQNGGKTIAVMGTPIDQVYPKSNIHLYQEICSNHLVVSQFCNQRYPGKRAFPMRNRTMALISDATIIIEATENSGTRHQGWEAIKMNRDVFILDNVIKSGVTWAKKMLEHGAVPVTRENIDFLLDNITMSTSQEKIGLLA